TPLLLAISNGYKAIVKLLFIRDNIDLNSKDKYRAMLLLLAAEYRSKTIVKLLLKDSVDVKSKDKYSKAPLW
ncbi:uncharacterized protein K441DRAFT_567106, partial [Cenococcum geophilum 1.58]|uniref:uncharacterized protein n=1 Tax=Cenococcum geophilum 1.58 TaxID=794803 RepID=UPI00358E410D